MNNLDVYDCRGAAKEGGDGESKDGEVKGKEGGHVLQVGDKVHLGRREKVAAVPWVLKKERGGVHLGETS